MTHWLQATQSASRPRSPGPRGLRAPCAPRGSARTATLRAAPRHPGPRPAPPRPEPRRVAYRERMPTEAGRPPSPTPSPVEPDQAAVVPAVTPATTPAATPATTPAADRRAPPAAAWPEPPASPSAFEPSAQQDQFSVVWLGRRPDSFSSLQLLPSAELALHLYRMSTKALIPCINNFSSQAKQVVTKVQHFVVAPRHPNSLRRGWYSNVAVTADLQRRPVEHFWSLCEGCCRLPRVGRQCDRRYARLQCGLPTKIANALVCFVASLIVGVRRLNLHLRWVQRFVMAVSSWLPRQVECRGRGQHQAALH